MAGAALVLGVAACDAGARRPPADSSWTLATHPRALDRYTRLKRRQLTDPDPRAVQQLIQCELGRVSDALGPGEMDRRSEAALDTAYRDDVERRTRLRLEPVLGGAAFEVGGPLCDSLNAAADREEGPIPRAADSVRARW